MCMHENSSGVLSRSGDLPGHYTGIQAPAQKSIANPALMLNATAQSKDCFYKHPSPKSAFETDTYCIGFFRTKMCDVLLVNRLALFNR